MQHNTKAMARIALGLTALLAAMMFLSLYAPLMRAQAHYCNADYYGEGQSIGASYTVEYDYYVEHDDYVVSAAPSYSSVTEEQTNNCASKAGANIVGFYDRYYPNLIPNFEPGVASSSGVGYIYFPRVNLEPINTLITDLYYRMDTNVGEPGATAQDFKDGLTEYVNEKGYNISFSSFYQNSTSVNYSKVQQMVSQNKVGVLMCGNYNIVFGISHDASGTSTLVSKRDYNIAHMMMVYGYLSIDYYKDGSKIRTDTFLQVSTGFAAGEKGYIRMDDYLTIDDALIINIS